MCGVAMLDVALLGGASFSAQGTVIRSDLGPAGRLLACYLFAFNGRVHRRERLADLFWSEVEPDKGRAALNTAIWRIRKILELGAEGAAKRLVTIGDEVILEPWDALRVDTHQLEKASRQLFDAIESQGPSGVILREFSSAVTCYHGPFLDGHDGDWILQERERLHCLFVRSAFTLMHQAARQAQYELALEYGRRILAVDALRESIQRDVMLLLVLNGQRAEAIRSYERLAKLLRSELDIDPMPETTRLKADIQSGRIFDCLNELAASQFNLSSKAIE